MVAMLAAKINNLSNVHKETNFIFMQIIFNNNS